MSTGDARRPSDKPSTKAAATGGKDDVIDSDVPAKAKTEQPRPGARTAAKAATRTANRAGAKPVAGRPPTKGGKGKKVVAPIGKGRNWGPIAMFGGAGVLAVLIIGFGAFALIKEANKPAWGERAAGIDGIHNYLVSNPDWFKVPAEGNHKAGVLQYPTSPPVGGIHNGFWQNCMGDIYTSEVAKEQATHSMEHGAVWVTYKPGLAQDQIDQLADKVEGKPFMLMSPYPGLDSNISLQAWGYQLKVTSASDERIDDFIDALRQNATQEPQAGCSSGITDATPQPLDLTPPDASGAGAGAGAGG
jgi:hypothetical protein